MKRTAKTGSIKTDSHRRRLWIVLAAVAAFVAVEVWFDVIEIAVGRLLLLTNPLRPQTGRLWEEDHKEQAGISEVEEAVNREADSPVLGPVRTMADLENALRHQPSVSLTREEFLAFYRSLSPRRAKLLLDPLLLLELNRSENWRRTQVSQAGDQLVLHFLDGYDNLLQESYSPLTMQAESEASASEERLEDISRFAGRIVDADLFHRAFERLDRSLRLQIVNDPYKLVIWGADLMRVGIAGRADDEGVEFAFEVRTDSGTVVHSLHASDVAAAYLIQEMNALDPALNLEPPVR